MNITRHQCYFLGIVMLLVLSIVTNTAHATEVDPLETPFTAQNSGPVVFETLSTSPVVITCEKMEVLDTVPNRHTNPSPGSVVTDVPSTNTTNVSTIGSCKIGSEVESASLTGELTFAWNEIDAPPLHFPILSVSVPEDGIFMERPECTITIGQEVTQSFTGAWTNGSTEASKVVFKNQTLEATPATGCPYASFDRVKFSGTFLVYNSLTKGPITVF